MRTELLLGGEWVSKEEKLSVVYPYTGEVVAEVSKASEEDVYKAIEVAKEGHKKLSSLSSYERYEILMRASHILGKRAE